MTTDNNFRVKNGVVVGNGSVATNNGSGLNLSGPVISVISTSTNDIDLYTNNFTADGVEVWLQHNNQVAINTANGAYSWTFKNDGTQGFPQLTTPHAGTGQTLRFNDPSQQVIITNSTATGTYPNSTRIVIQGSEGYSTGGEGGDIYLWAGNSGAGGGSGGDIKIDAGQGYSDSEGGTIKIRAGGSDGGNGGFVDIHGGQGVDAAGPIRAYSGNGSQQLQIDNAGVQVLNNLIFGDSTVQTTAYTGGGGNPFDQNLYTTSSVTFASVTATQLLANTVIVGTITLNDENGVLTPTTSTPTSGTYNQFFMNYETGFVDLTGNTTVSSQANATTSTSVVKYGTASGYFGGMNSYIDCDGAILNQGTGDWTWDSWVYINSGGSNEILFSFANNDSLELQWTDGAHGLAVYSNVDGFQSGYHNGSFSIGTWHHVFMMKASGVYYYGLDGTIVTGTSTGVNVQTPLTLGLSHRGPYGSDIYLDMTRWSNTGIFPTSGTYTVPTESSYIPPGAGVSSTSSIAVNTIEANTASVTAVQFADTTVQTTAWTGSVSTSSVTGLSVIGYTGNLGDATGSISTSSVTGLSTIAYTGNLGDATGSISTSSVTGLSTVGYTNDYNDLSNKPTIPAAFDLSTVTNQALFTTSSVRFTGLSLSTGTQVQKVVSSGGFPLNSAGTASIFLSTGVSPAMVVSNYSGSLVPNIQLRGYGQNRPNGLSTTQGNSTLNIESSRGTNSAPTAVVSGDSLGGINIGGFDGANWTADTSQGFNFIGYYATETWTSTGTTTLQAGSGFNQFIQPAWTRPGTNTTRQRIQITSWTTSSTGPSQLNWGIGSGVDGTAPTMTMVDGTTYTGYGRANIGFSNANILISGVPLQDTAPDNVTLTGTNFMTILGSRKSGATGRRNPIVVGDALGVVQFNGQSATNSTGVGVTGAYINAVALDNFSGGTTRGTRFNVFTVNSGTSISSGRMFLDDNFNTFASNAHVFQNKNQSFTALALTTATAVFTAIPQFPAYTAAAAGAITGALGQQICISDSPTAGGQMAFWDTTNSRWSYIQTGLAV